MSTTARTDVTAELGAPDLRQRLDALGFSADDAADTAAAAVSVLERPADLATVQEAVERLVAGIGVLPPTDGKALWAGLAVDADGVLPLLALVASAPSVALFHAFRGVPVEISAATLADLGQQTRVHRLVHGTFGLGTYAWETGYVWSGALYRLGRLQFDLELQPPVDGDGEQEWVLSTHVPRTGRLAAVDVEASLAAAPAFFATHFGEHPARGVHCRSWLLDPRVPELLPDSNLAAFQRRWRTYGRPGPGDEDALFFGFARQGPADPAELVAQTSLQRAILSVWRAGESWRVVDGRLAP